ncbi:GNAT family N-acetyltransferase [Puerhibacterium puerhi]|uniref:GNAT family N-acetyltransferase n=1 Tax=Puerhibacterium puerhi TaxID=2692623 RepID=UPI00135B9CAF|nr:GNAT family N-acetyltransferase [Puerhibacterium puerhi]
MTTLPDLRLGVARHLRAVPVGTVAHDRTRRVWRKAGPDTWTDDAGRSISSARLLRRAGTLTVSDPRLNAAARAAIRAAERHEHVRTLPGRTRRQRLLWGVTTAAIGAFALALMIASANGLHVDIPLRPSVRPDAPEITDGFRDWARTPVGTLCTVVGVLAVAWFAVVPFLLRDPHRDAPPPLVGEAPADGGLEVRPYAPADAPATLAAFRAAITVTGRSAYDDAQLAAWLGAPPQLEDWDRTLRAATTFVAVLDGTVAGFAVVRDEGYVDRLFVHPRSGRRGVARALLARATDHARACGAPEMTTHASLVARPVFERAGFRVVERETVVRHGVALDRFVMRRPLG